MLGSNLVVKLLLQTGAFSNDIKTAEKQIKGLKGTIDKASSGVEAFGKGLGINIGALTKFGGVVGAATLAAKSFKEIMNHNDALGDKYAMTMQKVNSHMESFWNSISSGNFSSFITNWKQVNKAAEEYSKALDDAGTYVPVLNAQLHISESRLNANLAIARDLTKSEAERISAVTAANKELLKQFNIKKQILELEGRTKITNLNELLADEGLKRQLTKSALEKLMQVESNGKFAVENRLAQFKERYEKYKAFEAQMGLGNSVTQFNGKQYTRAERDAYMKQYSWLPDYYEDWQKVNNVVQKHSQEVAEALRAYNDEDELNAWFNNLSKQVNNAKHKVESSIKTTGNDIEKLKKKLKFKKGEEPDITKERWYRPEGKQLTPREQMLEALPKFPDMDDQNWQEVFKRRQEQYKELFSLEQQLNGYTGYNIIDFSQIKFDGVNDNLQDMINKAKEAIDTARELEQTWKDLSSAMGSFGSILSSIGEISENKTLKVAGILAEAVAQISLSFANALAKEKMGTWGWIAAAAAGLATLTSTVAQVKSLNKFATGGIVGGNSFSGDNNLIRVNSGEMILNSHQQGNLFRMLNNGGGRTGQVKFHIEGRELIGVLNNYTSKRSKTL